MLAWILDCVFDSCVFLLQLSYANQSYDQKRSYDFFSIFRKVICPYLFRGDEVHQRPKTVNHQQQMRILRMNARDGTWLSNENTNGQTSRVINPHLNEYLCSNVSNVKVEGLTQNGPQRQQGFVPGTGKPADTGYWLGRSRVIISC